MAENKTKETDASVQAFLEAVDDEKKREDAYAVLALMREATGLEPKMWGPSIVGFGSYHYKYDSGREGDSPLTGFSPRKAALTLYIMGGFDTYDDLMRKLGKYKTGKGCLYLKRLSDVDEKTLKELVTRSADHMAKTHA
ncbi:MAG: DUF1801 domain-containing protein [Anaerolineae bacterium]|nr:DUF1801 domain-containing protein [Anaerolineae bacterium]